MAEYKDYTCTYPFDGGEWGIVVRARSEREASQRLRAMSRGVVDGELIATIPYAGGLGGWLTRAIVGVRNMFT